MRAVKEDEAESLWTLTGSFAVTLFYKKAYWSGGSLALHTVALYMYLLHFVCQNIGFQKSYCSHNCVVKCAKSCRET